MTDRPVRPPFGLWTSPLSAERMAAREILGEAQWSGDGRLIWTEERSGQTTLLVGMATGQAPRVLNQTFSARGRIGYGGGGFAAGYNQAAFVDGDSGRLLIQSLDRGLPRSVTPPFGGAAAPAFSPDGRWLLFIHTFEGDDGLAIVDAAANQWPQKLVSGDDFYMQPAWHPSGEWIAWVSWNHPQMPWDGARLFTGRLVFPGPETSGGLPALAEKRHLAGDEQTSIFQPAFSPDGKSLVYVSDATGWWQLYLYDLESGHTRQVTHTRAEHGQPAWAQGQRSFTFSADGREIYFLRNQMAADSLWCVDLDSGSETRVSLDAHYTSLEQISASKTPAGERLALLASGDRTPKRLLEVDPMNGEVQVRARATTEELPPESFVSAEHLEWEGEKGEPVYGLYYDPRRLYREATFTPSEKPPLVLIVHGGPTGQASRAYNAEVQFFTTRGYAVLEVNYRGSTGYGREYRNELYGSLGIADVEDSISGARYLSELDQIDPGRMAIIGGSSGGTTALLALARYPGFFKAGIVRYPVVDLLALAEETHKFEAHYNDLLIGPLPEAAPLYRERSPLSHLHTIQDPIAVFHGEDDRVVPLNQALLLREALTRRGVPFVFHTYPNEGHGFRKPETRIHYYREIEKFLRRYVVYP